MLGNFAKIKRRWCSFIGPHGDVACEGEKIIINLCHGDIFSKEASFLRKKKAFKIFIPASRHFSRSQWLSTVLTFFSIHDVLKA
jgi:hypothetical protein